MALPIEVELGEGAFGELAHAVRLAGGDDIIVGLGLLQHEPHRLDIVPGEAPVALRLEIAEVELLLQPFLDAADGARHLARDEGLAAPRALVVEENAVADEEAVSLAVVDGVPMA